jgi:hypothetical protein
LEYHSQAFQSCNASSTFFFLWQSVSRSDGKASLRAELKKETFSVSICLQHWHRLRLVISLPVVEIAGREVMSHGAVGIMDTVVEVIADNHGEAILQLFVTEPAKNFGD